MQTIVDTTFTGKNISSAVFLYEYVAVVDGTFRIQIRLGNIAGNGFYTIYMKLNKGDIVADEIIEPKTVMFIPTGETSCWLITGNIDLKTGDAVNIFALGLAGDTAVAGNVRIFKDNYTTDALINIGSIAHVVTVTDGVNPISGILVWASSDGGGATILSSGYTDALGKVTLLLDAGTYYLWKRDPNDNYAFTNPETIVVA